MDDMLTLLVEILEEKGVIIYKEWEERIKPKSGEQAFKDYSRP